MTLIRAENISFAYDSLPVLKDICFEIHQGDYVALVGENGSGKSTLLKLIIGEFSPQEGSLYLFERPVKDFKEWHKIGYVAQFSDRLPLHFPISVEEYVMTGMVKDLGLFRCPTKKNRKRLEVILDKLDLSDFRHRPMSDLSGGQAQRLAIAKLMAQSPELVLFDEPTTGFDDANKALFYELTASLNRQWGVTVIVVSHELRGYTFPGMQIFEMHSSRLECPC